MSLKQELDAFTEMVKERLGPHARWGGALRASGL